MGLFDFLKPKKEREEEILKKHGEAYMRSILAAQQEQMNEFEKIGGYNSLFGDTSIFRYDKRLSKNEFLEILNQQEINFKEYPNGVVYRLRKYLHPMEEARPIEHAVIWDENKLIGVQVILGNNDERDIRSFQTTLSHHSDWNINDEREYIYKTGKIRAFLGCYGDNVRDDDTALLVVHDDIEGIYEYVDMITGI